MWEFAHHFPSKKNSQIPQYQWKKLGAMVQRSQREQARDFNDHAVDAIRYALSMEALQPEPMVYAQSKPLVGYYGDKDLAF